MKKCILFFLFWIHYLGFSQCPNAGDIILSSQEDIDEYVATYSTSCDRITGNLIIISTVTGVNSDGSAASEISDLSGLNFLKIINGNLTITVNVDQIVGFNNLTNVRGDIEITSSNSLQRIEGFNNLTYVERIVVAFNSQLKTINGFQKIETISKSLEIGDCESLTEIDGFQNLKIIRGELNISKNKSLYKIPTFQNLVLIENDLNFTSNPSLLYVNGFYELTTIGNDLNIQSIQEISGFDKLKFIHRFFDIRGVATQKIPSFDSLEEVGAGFRIQNTSITTINGFKSLLRTGNSFFLEDWFILSENTFLNTVTGFGQFVFVEGFFEVKNNPQLNDCSWMCNLLNNGKITGSLIIQNNLGNCANSMKIVEICDPDFDDDGIANVIDFDDDNDGILDTDEGNGLIDTDKDGFPDSMDLDSDNDNCFDVLEAGFEDNNSDGILGGFPVRVDFNGRVIGVSSGYTTPFDANSNGIFDFQEESTLNPGKNGIVQFCLNSPKTNLINALNGTPDEGGIWFPALASNTSIFDPLVDSPGIYTYKHIHPVCGERTAQVLVEIPSVLSAGLNAEVIICNENAIIDLFKELNGNPSPGGFWSPELKSKTGVFNASLDKEGIYKYSIIDDFCGTISSTVTVKKLKKPNAGIGTKIEICEFSPSINLFELLSGNPDNNGVWSPNLPNGVFDPLNNVSNNYIYTVNNGACGVASSTVEVTVLKDNPLTNVLVKVNDFSATNNSIEIVVLGKRDYEYSLDGFQYQSQNIFNNVSGGEQTVYVRGVDGCEFYTEKVFVKTYPTFFTPNNDGQNDYWRLKYFPDVPYTIFIYNRFGKPIKEISSKTGFWDGNSNGKPMESSNYWFKVVTETGQIFTGNFSLLRK